MIRMMMAKCGGRWDDGGDVKWGLYLGRKWNGIGMGNWGSSSARVHHHHIHSLPSTLILPFHFAHPSPRPPLPLSAAKCAMRAPTPTHQFSSFTTNPQFPIIPYQHNSLTDGGQFTFRPKYYGIRGWMRTLHNLKMIANGDRGPILKEMDGKRNEIRVYIVRIRTKLRIYFP